MLLTCTLRMQEGLQASVQMLCVEFTVHRTLQMPRSMWRQRAVAEGVLPLPCPFIIACRFIVSVSSCLYMTHIKAMLLCRLY